jgi:xylulokinase
MKVTDAAVRLLGVDHAGFEALVLEEPVGAGGLVMLPYLDGERTPNRPNATGILQGLRSDVRRSQLARASVEGVVCGLLDGLDALSACGVRTDGRLFLIGGGSRSAAFRQTVADLAQRTVFVPDADEHVATGACLQAAAVWFASQGRPIDGIVGALSKAWGLGGGTETHPNPTANAGAVRLAYAALRDAAVAQ